MLGGAGALFGSAIIYASFGVLIRESSKMFGNGAQVVLRFALAALIVTLLQVLLKKTVVLHGRDLLKTIGLGIGFGLVVMLFTISVNETKVANSVFLIYAGSITSSLIIGTVFLKEKLSIAKVFSVIVALAGLSLFAGGLMALSLGAMAGFASGLFDGAANAVRKTLKGVDRNSVIAYSYAVGAVVVLGVTLISGERWVYDVSLLPVIAMLVFVGFMIWISNLLLYGFQHFDVNVGTVILSTELVFATLFGYVFLHESPTTAELIGGALIFMASVLAVVDLPSAGRRVLSKIRGFNPHVES